jgi:hypothetical protein
MFVLNLRGGAFVSRRSVSLPGCRAGCFEDVADLVVELRVGSTCGVNFCVSSDRPAADTDPPGLFLVGARLEPPSIVDRLLWTSDRTPHTVSTSI